MSLMASPAANVAGDYLEPHPELTFSEFIAPLLAQVARIGELKLNST
jgi:hypothetical protein